MMKTHHLTLTALLTAAGAALAAFVVPWRTLDGGGAASSGGVVGGPTFTVTGTIGQFDAHDTLTGGGFAVTGGYWASWIVPGEGNGPRLQISQVSGQRVLSWPESAAGWILQKSIDLTSWTDIGTALTGEGILTMVPPDSNQPAYFYRLKQPQSP
jgi:hypothetical protein